MQFNYKLKYLAIIIIVISGYFFLHYSSDTIDGYTFCIFKNLTGFPCPACGSTRATVALLHGNFLESIQINPLAILTNVLIVASVIWMLIDLVRKKQSYFFFMKKKWNWNWKITMFLILTLIANWILNIQKQL